MDDKKENVARIVGDDNVLDNMENLDIYSRDHSLSIQIKPMFIVRPKNSSEVQKIVYWANQSGTALVPMSSGPPHFHGSAVPSTPEAVIVDLSRMKNILQIDHRNKIVVIEPGVTYSQLQPQLAEEGLRLSAPLIPKSNKSVVASLLEREPSLIPRYHWTPLDPLRCLEVIWGDGNKMLTGDASLLDPYEKARTDKPSPLSPTGPGQTDFYHLISGSQGSMGIVTWASIKCETRPKLHKLFFVPSKTLHDLVDFVYRILKLRLGDEIFLLNNVSLASILAEEVDQINELKEVLPPWIAFLGIAGRNMLPQEKVKYQETNIMETAKKYNLHPVNEIPGAKDHEIMEALFKPYREPYWKLRYKGFWRDILFLTTLDKTPEFTRTLLSLAEEYEYPLSDINVYIQPIRQGVNCHCEFGIPYSRETATEITKIKDFFKKASEELFKKGAYFSRPYGVWANMSYNRDAQTTILLKRIKSIFDPHNIMNPGKLCF